MCAATAGLRRKNARVSTCSTAWNKREGAFQYWRTPAASAAASAAVSSADSLYPSRALSLLNQGLTLVHFLAQRKRILLDTLGA